MNVLPANQENLSYAAKQMDEGKIVVFYADGVYAMGCNALDEQAVQQVFALKRRNKNEALQVVIAKEDIPKYADVGDREKRMIDVLVPGPISVVVKNKLIPAHVNVGLDTVCIGWQESWIVQGLYYKLGKPYVGTSANISGTPPPTTVQEAIRNLGDQVACYIDNGPSKYQTPNSIVDLTRSPIQMLRKGPISLEEIQRRLEQAHIKQ